MKKIFTLFTIVTAFSAAQAQNALLCDFDSIKHVSFKDYDGILDSNFVNPMTTGANTSARCARYIRKATQYDNLKLYAHTKFIDVAPYAQANAPANAKISMMVMSNMPVGSKIDVQLGTRTDQNYPSGIHSIYTGTTTVRNQWENITFMHTSTPLGGFSMSGSIDKFIILFNTNALTADTVYFDYVVGPNIEAAVGIQEMKTSTFKISQNVPNPASDNTSINVDLTVAGHVNLTIYDMLGKAVATPVNNDLSIGSHNFTVETVDMPNGVYFYTVKSGNVVQTRKMVVSK